MRNLIAALALLTAATAGPAQAGFCDSAVNNALIMQRTAWQSKDTNDATTAAILAGVAGMIVGWFGRGKRQ